MSSQKSMVGFNVLRLLWKFVTVGLNVAVTLASDGRQRPRYTAGKAQQLYEDGVITGSDYAKCIYGDK